MGYGKSAVTKIREKSNRSRESKRSHMPKRSIAGILCLSAIIFFFFNVGCNKPKTKDTYSIALVSFGPDPQVDLVVQG